MSHETLHDRLRVCLRWRLRPGATREQALISAWPDCVLASAQKLGHLPRGRVRWSYAEGILSAEFGIGRALPIDDDQRVDELDLTDLEGRQHLEAPAIVVRVA